MQYFFLLQYLMGAESGKTKTKQVQIVEQNYANNIMLLAFSTLESICCKAIGASCKSSLKKFGQQDKVDYSMKNMQELIGQLKTHLFLFKVSKQQMDSQFQNGFIFPKNFTKQDALKQVSNFKSICLKANDTTLINFCDDFTKIVMGKYDNLYFQKADVRVVYNDKQKEYQKRQLLKDGINATTVMHELREQVQKNGLNNPLDLTVKLSKPSVEYEKFGKKY